MYTRFLGCIFMSQSECHINIKICCGFLPTTLFDVNCDPSDPCNPKTFQHFTVHLLINSCHPCEGNNFYGRRGLPLCQVQWWEWRRWMLLWRISLWGRQRRPWRRPPVTGVEHTTGVLSLGMETIAALMSSATEGTAAALLLFRSDQL